MTRFDIRLRRQRFKESRIEQYKNYHSLLERHEQFHRKRTRGIMVLVAMILIIIALSLALFHRSEPVKKTPQRPTQEQLDKTSPNELRN